MQFRFFFKVKVQNWDIFWVAKISNIFLGCLKFLIFFRGEQYMLGPSLRMRKKLEYPPPPGCELRYRPIGTMFFKQEYNLLFPIPKKNVIFNTHHLLFQNQ